MHHLVWKAFACKEVLGCCAGSGPVIDEWLSSWIRERTYATNVPVPAVPLPICEAPIGDTFSSTKFCNQCVFFSALQLQRSNRVIAVALGLFVVGRCCPRCKQSVEAAMESVECRWTQPTAFRPPTDLQDNASPRAYDLDPFAQVAS